jgi:hypothetical protein
MPWPVQQAAAQALHWAQQLRPALLLLQHRQQHRHQLPQFPPLAADLLLLPLQLPGCLCRCWRYLL